MSPSNKRMAQALGSAPKLVIATVALMEELVRILIQEMEVVTARKLDEHPTLLKYKQKLAMDYRSNMKLIAADPLQLKQLPDEAKSVIREMAATLAEVSAKNAVVLRAAVNAAQQLIQNVVAMVKSESLTRPSYKNPATAHLQLGIYSPTCAPVAVNRSV